MPTPLDRVLVVDNDRDVADLLTEILLIHDIPACAAYSGAEALEAAQTLRPATVLLNLWMPNLDGFAVAAALARTSPPPYLVAMSAVDDPATRASTRAAGFGAHIRKPLSIETIVNAVKRPHC